MDQARWRYLTWSFCDFCPNEDCRCWTPLDKALFRNEANGRSVVAPKFCANCATKWEAGENLLKICRDG